jgi:hypothetical protein
MAAEKAIFGMYGEEPLNYISASGAIPLARGKYILNGSGVQAMTLALPTATTPKGVLYQDGTEITIISASAHAHTITTPANGINGADDTVTFGGAVGNLVKLLAVNGSWIVTGNSGATLSEV